MDLKASPGIEGGSLAENLAGFTEEVPDGGALNLEALSRFGYPEARVVVDKPVLRDLFEKTLALVAERHP